MFWNIRPNSWRSLLPQNIKIKKMSLKTFNFHIASHFMFMFFFYRYDNTVSPVWQWHISVSSHLVLLPFKRWYDHLHCFCNDKVCPEFSSLHLRPLRSFPKMVAATFFIHGSCDESCWRLDIPHCCHDSVWCLWEPCSLLWDPCHGVCVIVFYIPPCLFSLSMCQQHLVFYSNVGVE